MDVLDLRNYGISKISWLPSESTKRVRNSGGRGRGKLVGRLMMDFTVTVAPMPYQQAREAEAIWEGLEGSVTPFEVIIPLTCIPSGAAKNTGHGPTVASGSGYTLNTTGWPANVTDLFKAGDLIRLASPTKMYKIKKNAHSDASGNCTLTLTRALVAPVIGGEALIFNPASLVVTQPNSAQEFTIPGDKQSTFELDFEEWMQ